MGEKLIWRQSYFMTQSNGHPEFHFMKMCEKNLTALYIKPDPICYIFRPKLASPLQT